MRIVLTVISGPLAGRSREFAPAPALIRVGRASRADFSLHAADRKDLAISREHCVLEVAPPVCRVRDAGANNGIRVNDRPVEWAELNSGDRIRLSKQTELRIDIAPDPDEPPPGRSTLDSWDDHYEVVPGSPCLVCTQPPPLHGVVCSACRQRRSRDPQPVPGYLLLRELGRGGMGVVWLAEEQQSNRRVAVKLIRPDLEATGEQIDRFLREARTLRDLDHANIVPFRAMGESAGLLHFVMDYVPGTDAARLVRDGGPLPIRRAVRIVLEMLDGLAYAHGLGVIHRDLKPANLLVVERPWNVRLADFGLAFHAEQSKVSRLTQVHTLGGTLSFLPPEQALGLRFATPASDQYGAAATLYHLLTGCYVHDLPRAFPAQLDRILNYPAVPIRQRKSDLPPALAEVVNRALAVEPADRYPNVRAFARALRPFARSGSA